MSLARWSPDSKAFVVQKAMQNCTEVDRKYNYGNQIFNIQFMQVYKMAKKADGSLGDFSVAVSFPKVQMMPKRKQGSIIARCI